jgi:hypothetical protein
MMAGETVTMADRQERLDSLDRQVRSDRIRPIARFLPPFLDLRIGKVQRRSGRSDAARGTIRRIRTSVSEMGHLRETGDPDRFPNCLACIRAQLSTLVGRPGTAPSPAERAEIDAEQDRAMAELRRAVAAGNRNLGWSQKDPDLDPLRDRADFQALVLDQVFPADPFAP